MQINSNIDSLNIKKFTFEKSTIDNNSTKRSDTTLVYASYKVKSKSQHYNTKPSGNNLEFEVDWNGNEFDFLFNIDQANSPNYAKTSGHVAFMPDVTTIKLRPSEINLIDKIWKISEENLITLKTREYDLKKLSIYYDDQRITFNGKIDGCLIISIHFTPSLAVARR